MSSRRQNCNCQKIHSERHRPSSDPSANTDSDVYYDAFDDTEPGPSSKLQQSESVTAFLQKLGDPQNFKRALQNIIDTADNLKTIFEVVIEKSLQKCQRSFTTFIAPKAQPVISSEPNDQSPLNTSRQNCEYCGSQRTHVNGLNINVESLVVTVPLTLYIHPLVNEELPLPEAYIPPSISENVFRDDEFVCPDVNVVACCGEEEGQNEPNIGSALESSLVDNVEPIRTASISASSHRNSYSPSGFAKVMRFSEDQKLSEGNVAPHSSFTSITEPIELSIPEPDRGLEEQPDFDQDHMIMAEKEDSVGTAFVSTQELPFPQQKNLRLCVPCSCKQCPVYDHNQQIVCPRKCNCCICPWRDSAKEALSFHELRVCPCSNREPRVQSSIPTSRCQCPPNFGICPCLEVEDSRQAELYDRSGATQNDRHRDHSNLKHQPNIEAPAGLGRQPAGHRQNPQAKDENDEEEYTNSKNRASWNKKFTLISSRLSSNDREDGHNRVSFDEHKLKMTFADKCMEPQGSYECVYGVEDGSCHKFWCKRKEKFNKNDEGAEFRDFEISQNGSFDGRYDKTKDEETLRKSESGLPNDEMKNMDGSLKSLETATSPPEDFFDNQTHKKLLEVKYPCFCECSHLSIDQETKLRGTPRNSENRWGSDSSANGFEDSRLSTGTAMTPRPTMDPSVIPLLQSIFDVLQSIREDQLRMRSSQLDEPLTDLPQPQLPSHTQNLRTFSAPSFKAFIPSSNNSVSSLRSDRGLEQYVENNNVSLDVLEPPERDVKDLPTRTQRLIPVDMDLLRTDDDLGWDPQVSVVNEIYPVGDISSHDSKNTFLETPNRSFQPHFLQFPEDEHGPKASHNKLDDVDGTDSKQTSNQNSHLKTQQMEKDLLLKMDDCECTCEDTKACADTCCRKSIKEFDLDPKSEEIPKLTEEKPHLKDEYNQTSDYKGTPQEIQVNTASLKNMASQSVQSLKIHEPVDDISEEKLIKKSYSISRSTEETLPVELTKSLSPKKNKDLISNGTDNPSFVNEKRASVQNCYCHQETVIQQNPDMSNFIQSLLYDLKAMQSFRENSAKWHSFAKISSNNSGGWQRPSKDLSYPATIESVQELGTNSLFVKWKVQNKAFIVGYEVFLDGQLTNRYFSCVHQAAVICNVNIKSPHRITLRAQPLLPTKTPQLTPDSNFLTCTPDGSVWYPSVYHFEPNLHSAPSNAVLY